MPERAPQPASSDQDAPRQEGLASNYAALETALLSSPRGRWFLAEYLRRNRSAETELLLEAIGRLEVAVRKPQTPAQAVHASQIFDELVKMSEAISRTRREIAQIRPPHQFDKQLGTASEELDHIVEATETATSEILQAAEDIQEAAWSLREKGIEIALCDTIDQRATDIYTACSFQDITGQRTAKVVKALRYIEQRINAMIEIWGVEDIAFTVDRLSSKLTAEVVQDVPDSLSRGPQGHGGGLKQDDVDAMLTEDERLLPKRSRQSFGPAGDAKGAPPESDTSRTGRTRSETGFERPEPLTLAQLQAVKRAALFG